MKKLVLLMMPMLLLCLTGCSEETGQVVCTLSSKDAINEYELVSEYKINYKGDFVESVETTETVTSESEDILNTFESTLNETYKKMNDVYGGYTYEVTKEKGKVVSNVEIDYNTMDVEQLVKDQPTFKSYVEDNKLSVEGLKTIYESTGATCQ